MARTNIARTTAARTGVEPTMTAVDATASPNGMQVDWTENLRLLVKTSGTTTTATIDIPTLVDGQSVTDRAVVVPATTAVGMVIGPFPPEYRQADGKLYVNFSSATGATVTALV
jgi:hypothetical protein